MSDQITLPQKEDVPDKLHHPKIPAEEGKGNLLPEDRQSIVKPVPDPVPGRGMILTERKARTAAKERGNRYCMIC